MKKVLTIAGSDSGGGAGMQADLKTFAACGVYGMSAITAITAQNTLGVQGIYTLPASFVGKQIDSVMDDIGADVWKIGMLSNSEVIGVVLNRIKKYKVPYIVLDPVMVAKGGNILLQKDARDSLIKKLIPLAFVITPNLHETEVITGLEIKSIGEMKKAAIILFKQGANNVVIKGGHLEEVDDATDILYDGESFYEFRQKRIQTKNTHGTGCTFASAISAYLAKGENIYVSVKKAKKYVTRAIIASNNLHIGHGHGPLNHFIEVIR